MLLRDYLKVSGLTYLAFARRIGSDHARTVERYAKGKQRPNAEMMARIVSATTGAVTANDFFGIVDPGALVSIPTEAVAAHD